MAVTVLLTGALHEDGWADCWDGLGGGRSAEDALRIMKDSRIGAYGALALGLLLVGRVGALTGVTPWAMVGAGALSRLCMAAVPAVLPPARPGGTGAMVAGGPGVVGLVVAGVMAWAAWGGLPRVAVAFVLCLGAAWVFTRVLRRRLGGFTGDALGAVQAGTELLALIVLAWRAG